MSRDLHLCRINLNMPALYRLAKERRLPPFTEDDGYTAHSTLREAFGECAPLPFSMRPVRGAYLPVLGYSNEPADALLSCLSERRSDFPLACGAVSQTSMESKQMPGNWRQGTVLDFEVKICPVVRKARGAQNKKPGAEIDVFLDALPNDGSTLEQSREDVYSMWLRERFLQAGVADLVTAKMTGFRLATLVRRSSNRKAHTTRRPEAIFCGKLCVNDGPGFSEWVRRGIGRHRAFGFGMLLLRPAGR